MNRVGIDRVTLADISEKLGDEWKKLAIHLGFDEAKIRTFEVNNPGNVDHQRFQMLTEWTQGQEPSTEGQIGVLCSGLKKINRTDIVTWLQQRTGLACFTPNENCQEQLAEDYKVTTDTTPVNSLKPSRTVATGGLGHQTLTRGLKERTGLACFTPMDNCQQQLAEDNIYTTDPTPVDSLKPSRTVATGGLGHLALTQGLKVGIEDPILSDISEELGDEWKKLAIHLGFDEAKIRTFEVNNPRDVHHQRFQMLTEWRRGQPSIEGQMDMLCCALEKISRNDIVVWLQGRPVVPTPLEYCQQQLTQHYKKTTSTIPAHPADPSRTVAMGRFYSDLELTRGVTGKQTSPEPIRLRGETQILDEVHTVALDSWDDMLNTYIMGSLKIILSGGAGCGKSTLLLRVANASIDPKAIMAKFKLVFLVLLKKMQQSSCVLKAIWDQIFPKNTQLRKADLKKVIDDNEADTLILLDGLDEIPSSVLNSPSKEDEYGVNDILENRVLVKSCVIVTTRPHMIDLKKYTHYARVQTRGFTFKVVKKYITEYFVRDVSLGEALKSNLESNQSLQTLAQIPIIVLFMCIVWKNQELSELPDRLTQLYTQFAKALVSGRCNEGEDQSELMESVMRRLGRVALNGLLDPNGVRLLFSPEEFDEKDLEDGCRLGFLQQEHFTSGLEAMCVVTFFHKSFQEYSAAYYLASLYRYPIVGKFQLRPKLRRINADNVRAMENLLRFTCGLSSKSPTTGVVLEHVRKLKKRESDNKEQLQQLARLLLFESSSSKWAGKLERPTKVVSDTVERWNIDLKALQYYLQCVPRSPVITKRFHIGCRSYEDITILSDILLSDKILSLGLLTRIKRTIFENYDRAFWSCSIILTDQVCDALGTLDSAFDAMEDWFRDAIALQLTINKSTCIDDERGLGYLTDLPRHLVGVYVYDRSYHDVKILTRALNKCRSLQSLELHDTNLHNNLQCVASLTSHSLIKLELQRCGLKDDDIPDLIEILPTKRGSLHTLDITGNEFSVDRLETLCSHLHVRLPALEDFYVGYTGPNEESLRSMVRQYLPNVSLNFKLIVNLKNCDNLKNPGLGLDRISAEAFDLEDDFEWPVGVY